MQFLPCQICSELSQGPFEAPFNNFWSPVNCFPNPAGDHLAAVAIWNHIDVEAHVGVPKSTMAETGIGVTSRP